MSKIKLSFSLIVAIFLVGILSTVAFAASTTNSISVTKDSTNTGFIVTVQRVTGTTVSVKQYTSENGTFTNEVDYTTDNGTLNFDATTDIATINVPNVEVGKIYEFALVDQNGNTVVKPKYAVYYTSLGQKMASFGNDPKKLLDVTGSGLANSTHTATDPVRKTDFRVPTKSQKLHGFYQNNTNSCASCHQTHTANNGEALLFKDGTYSTCSSCHDGTTGAYNAFETTSAGTTGEVAGTFNVDTSSVHNGSLHQADGSLQVSAAPGGNPNPDMTTTDAKGNLTAASIYGGEFDCASCHNPHGGGSNNENNLNEDPLGWGGIAYATTNNDTKNGKLFKSVQIVDLTTGGTLPTAMSTPYILVKRTLTDADSVSTTNNQKAGYLYGRAGAATGDKILQTYRWSGGIVLNGDGSIKSGGYVADYSLWLRSTGHVSAPFTNANTFFKDAGGNDITKTLNVVWRDGFIYGTGVDSVASAQISIGIDVESPKTTIDPNTGKDTGEVAVLVDSTNGNYVYDAGTEMSKYCATCHVDYLSGTRGNDTGVYTVAHRHATAQDRLSCVRCHYAHGSDATVMKDANDETYWSLQDNYGMTADNALNYLLDPNPSSAIKRYTGMSVCYACHGKGESFMANPNVNTNRLTGAVSGPYLLNGDPGTTRTTRTDVPVITKFQ